ncbi:type 1 glutamine amidotransferase family protein [Methanospirillum lacunae]|uniref:Glutamine amidotransferase n=1 Tax=Methanospirillum lacunae TaxID=668570 RepID=A0A2V2N1W7_9EURY|nr:type 1 glutamine amidotransferase family protein [Methanospirillum lacunae]PWR72630.1 glutamine amidotransferase [Methanospirillum lacunae]
MTNLLYLYIQDTMADWEPAFLLPELVSGRFLQSPDKKYHLRLCGRTRDPITTMGGLRLVPDMTIDEIEAAPDRLLILPGAMTWLEPIQEPVLGKVRDILETGMVVGAICGATMAIANAGLLNNRPHTSNDLEVLKQFCPGYSGEKYYQLQPAVSDGNLITASGVGSVDFAYEVMKKLGVMREETLEAWYQLYLTKKPEFFFKLMESLGQ